MAICDFIIKWTNRVGELVYSKNCKKTSNEFECFMVVLTVDVVYKAQDEQRTVVEQEVRESYFSKTRCLKMDSRS